MSLARCSHEIFKPFLNKYLRCEDCGKLKWNNRKEGAANGFN